MAEARCSGRSQVAAIVAALVLFAGGAATTVSAEVDVGKLRPGLVTTYRDAIEQRPDARRSPALEIVAIEPTIALLLKSGDAAHPRLSPDGGTIRWQGYLNVLRPGSYRFSVVLRGRFRLIVHDKEILTGEVKNDTPATITGPEVRLEAVVHR